MTETEVGRRAIILRKINELVDEIKAEFPEMTDCSIGIKGDGFRTIDVERWGKFANVDDIPNTPRRRIYRASSYDGSWLTKDNGTYNDYLKGLGLLLEEKANA